MLAAPGLTLRVAASQKGKAVDQSKHPFPAPDDETTVASPTARHGTPP